jgi:hypothetical protein
MTVTVDEGVTVIASYRLLACCLRLLRSIDLRDELFWGFSVIGPSSVSDP